MLDCGGVLRIAQADLERPLEGIERLLVLASIEVLPAEVVQQRAYPVRGGLGAAGELEPAVRPGHEAVAIIGGKRAHVRGVAGEPVLARVYRSGVCTLEERQRGVLVTRRAAEAPTLEVDPDPDAGMVIRDLVEQPLAGREVSPQPLDARELRQRLGAQRAKAALALVQVVEVPLGAEQVHCHRPVVEKCW